MTVIATTYPLEDGQSYHDIYKTRGTVLASDLECYRHYSNCPHDDVEQGLAHSYGELALGSTCCNYSLISEVLDSEQDRKYYCKRDSQNQQFAYRFKFYNTSDTQKAYPVFSKQIITASSGTCTKYEINSTRDENGATLFQYQDGSISIPNINKGDDSTTYIYRGEQIPQNESESGYACGARCMQMWAFKSRGGHNTEDRALFKCNINISSVIGDADQDTPAQFLSDRMARLAASSIGLSGRYTKKGKEKIWTQFQFYPFG